MAVKRNTRKVLFITLMLFSGCATKQYQYEYNLSPSPLNDWKVSTNLFCLIGVETLFASYVIGPRVRDPKSIEQLCDTQLNGKPTITLSGSSLPRQQSGVLIRASKSISLAGERGKLNTLGQCLSLRGPETFDCIRYETNAAVDFSDLAPNFHVDISVDEKKVQRLYFELNKVESIYY